MIHLAKKEITKEEKAMIEQVINLLKEHPIVEEMFNKYKMSIDDINDIPIDFEVMDVSAKAKEGNITLNKNLLEDNNLIEDLHYIVHELVHVLQFHAGRLENMKHYDDDHYLDNPFEIEAFKEQVKFINKYKDSKAAEDYLSQLLNFHGYKGSERAKKLNQLKGE